VPSFQLREVKEGPSHNVGSHGEPASIITKLPPPPSTEASFFKPNYRENPKPVYPPEARRKGYQGEVILKVEILPSGHTGKIELKKSSGHESLDRSALTAVKQWKFIPATEGEQRVASWVNIPIRFQIQ